MIKAKPYKGGDLKGLWEITFKIDGIRVLIDNEGYAYSRNEKPLPKLNDFPPGDYEVFCGTWEGTVTLVKNSSAPPVAYHHLYSLDPVDDRLKYGFINNPSEKDISELLKHAKSLLFEGLVLRQDDLWIKVKDKETHDVIVTHVIPGKGKHEGRMGALMTDKGKVGTGFTDAIRERFTNDFIVGKTIEVECMELTPDGKFRHGRFLRLRWDK